MAKNRYIKEGVIIKELDASFSAPDFFETDQNLQVTNKDGIYIYKVVDNQAVLRSQSEIDADFLPIYIDKKLIELRELIYTRWVDSSKTAAANQAQYQIVKSNIETATSIIEVDNKYNNFVTFMNLS